MRPKHFVYPLVFPAGALLALSTTLAAPLVLAQERATVPPTSHRPLDADQKAMAVLNRLAFGPRPGDIAAVQQMGIDRWIDQQLHPETIEDSAAQSKLSKLTSLNMSPTELYQMFREDQKANLQILKARQDALKGQSGTGTAAGSDGNGQTPKVPSPMGQTMLPNANGMPARYQSRSIQALGELGNSKLILAVDSKRQLQEVLVDFWSNHFNLDAKKGPVRAMLIADERTVIRPYVFGKFRDLLEASAKSPAMLYYLDNALSTRDYNDPNTAPQGMSGASQRPFPNRPFAFRRFFAGQGGFQAKPAAGQNAGQKGQAQKGGLNENYAREIMELHTLGVDGGYTQKDVTEVARCFTGWSIDNQTGAFKFMPFRHDDGEKVVLGHRIPRGGGMQDGETVLDILASSPATAHHIAFQLCQRLISDTPSKSLVDRAATTYSKTGGDMRAVIRTIATSPEMFAPVNYRSKTKSPLEYAVSAVRAIGATLDVPDPSIPRERFQLVADGQTSVNHGKAGRSPKTTLAMEIAKMGEPLFGHEAPTGFPNDSREWISSGTLLTRFNFATELASGNTAGIRVPETILQGVPINDNGAALDTLGRLLTGANLSAPTRAVLLQQMNAKADASRLIGLILGAPEFQLH